MEPFQVKASSTVEHPRGSRRWLRTWRKTTAALTMNAMLLVLFVLSAQRVAAADLSLRCIYDVVTGTHEAMVLCGDRLDHRDQAIYVELSESLKKFINDNAQSEAQKIGPDHNEKLKQHREMRVREGFCKQPDYAWFKERLLSILRTRQEEKRFASDLKLLVIHPKGTASDAGPSTKDHFGSISVITDGAGTVLERLSHDASISAATPTAATTPPAPSPARPAAASPATRSSTPSASCT